MKVHLWAPGIDPNSGGIETYSSFLLKALQERFGTSAVSVFAKNETGSSAGVTQVSGTGRLPLGVRTAAFSALVAARALVDRPDLILSTHLNFTPLARRLKEILGIPYAVSLHGIEAWGPKTESRRGGLAHSDLLLPVSSFTCGVVSKEQGLPVDRFRILPNAFDPSAFRIGPKPEYLLKRYGLAADQPVILTVGRLSSKERYKGQDRILRILSEVRGRITENRGQSAEDRQSDLRCPISDPGYLVVGDGDDRPRLEQLAEELGVRDLVIFAGKVPAKELCDHYNLCDVFAMPSTGEGFGIVFLEALACGKPVIAGNKDASRDALAGGELGILIDPDNLQELRDAIVAVLAEVQSVKFKVEGISTIRDGKPGLAIGCVTAHSAVRVPSIVFHPEELRAKVIEHFGYEKFKQRLSEILEPLLK